MESTNIEKLLEKYFEAATTVEEEQTLQRYFLQDNVAPHLEEYRVLFHYFSEAKEERFTKHVPLQSKRNTIYVRWISVAAVAVLLLGVYFGKTVLGKDDATIDDPEIAYQETKKALSLIAQNLNKGTDKIAYLNEFEQTKSKIFNND
jgi:hypothetical protein